MEATLIEILKSTPVAFALIYLVVVFLKSLDKRDDNFRQFAKDWTEIHRLTTVEMTEKFELVIDKNNEVIENASRVFQHMVDRCGDIQRERG